MNCYESYFKYKKDNKYSFYEYIVYNLYNGHFKSPYTPQKKSGFFCLFNNLLSKYTATSKVNKIDEVKISQLILLHS